MLTTALKMPHICIYTLCMQICAQADYYTLKWHIDLLALKGSCFPNVWNAINIRKNSLWGSLLVFSRLSCCAAATCPTGFCTQSPHIVTGEWEPSREWRWTGSGGRSPTPGTKAHRRGRTQPGTACCSGWPQSPASGTQTDWVTNRNTRWTVTGDCWGSWTKQSLPEQLMADFQFCVQVTVLSPIATILSIFYLLEQQRVDTSQSNLCTAHCEKCCCKKIPAFQLSVPQRNPPKLPRNTNTGSQRCHCQLLSWQPRVSPEELLSANDILGPGLAE